MRKKRQEKKEERRDVIEREEKSLTEGASEGKEKHELANSFNISSLCSTKTICLLLFLLGF